MTPAPAATSDQQPAQRFSSKGKPLLKPAGGPPALTKRHTAYIRFMVHGIDRAFPRWPDVEPHTPLDRNTAADIAGLRRKNARDLFNWPIFLTAYNREVAALRKGEHAKSIHTMIEVRDDPGAGKAADRKVRMQAAQALIGEGGSKVEINMPGSHQTIQPGVVIMLPPGTKRPSAHPPSIEHEDT